MAFKSFDFKFTPPRTVPAAPIESTTPDVAVSASTSGANSLAGQLVAQLDDLSAMSGYLQDAIVARTNTVAIEINPAADPDVSRALASIYSTDTPPNFITVPMYDGLLDAHLGAQQLEMAVGNDSTVQANPIQVADLMTVINTVDKHLIKSGTYKTWLPLQLASLKADQVLFESWKASLQTYPAYYAPQPLIPTEFRPTTIQAASIDIDHQLYQYESDVLTRFGQSYSGVYQAMASVHAVERDINEVMIEFFYQPLAQILRIVSLLNALGGFAHKTSMANLQGDLINYSFMRLASDTTSMLHTADQLVAMAVFPLKGTLGSLSRIVAGTQQQAAEIGFLTGGGLVGLSKANACAQGNPANKIKGGKPLNIPGLGAISDGLKALGEMLDWGFRETEKGLVLVDKSFRQLLERRLKAQDDRNSLMCSIRALNALMGIANGIAGEFQKGTVTANSTPQQKQEASTRILSSLQTGSNTTFVAQGTQVIVNPPDMPPAPPAVLNVLQQSKIRTTIGNIKS